MNLWHDIAPGTADELNVIIETPRGSNNKYEIDKETGLIKLDRANYSTAPYPFDYGFVPQTLWHDGDALDVVLFTTHPLLPGILVTVRPIGIMEMMDSGESDSKIIGVPTEDIRWKDIKTLQDLNPHALKEMRHFFETYKQLKGKPAPVEVGEFKDKSAAAVAFAESLKLYQEKFAK